MPKPEGFGCVYCGAPADTVEHTTPRAHLRAIDETDPLSLRQVLIPACMECNGTLSDYPYAEIVTRGAFLLRTFRKKWKKTLEAPVWSEEEINELGYALRASVLQQQLHRDEKIRRFAHLRQWEAWT